MRLIDFHIEAFKNLQDFSISFDETSSYTVLVGQNGAGKSNLIEALTYVFRNLDLRLPAPFSYKIKYRCRDNELKIEAASTRTPQVWVRSPEEADFKRLSMRDFMSEDLAGRPLYRPSFVFGYYSGPSDRLSELYDRHKERFYAEIIKPEPTRPEISANSYRRLFYAQTLHGQFALLAFFMSTHSDSFEDRDFLREHLQIEGLDSVLFALRQPSWPPRPGGDPRFWYAEGEVREFLSRLYEAAETPMRMPRRIQAELRKNPSVEFLYLFLPDQQALDKVYRTYADQYEFFTALESTHLSKLLWEVRTRVRVTPSAGGGALTYRDLSEGEQQLLLVLGLLKFTARDEALFLLDEPDTHLNPAWSTQYLEFLDRFIRMRSRGDSCHIVMSTHDPLVFAGLLRSQVRVFTRNHWGNVSANAPNEDPRGMGVAAILTSDLFKLRSTLDPHTQRLLDSQRILAMKSSVASLSNEEVEELRQIGTELDGMGFSRTIRDPLYDKFIKAWTEQEDPAWRQEVHFTSEQLTARNELARQIVEELKGEMGV